MAERTISTRLKLTVSGFTAPLKEASASVSEFKTSFAAAAEEGSAGFESLTEGAGIAGAAMLAGFGVAVNAAMAFDKQMSSVSAAANVTGNDLNALREAALKAGADTKFSAIEAAQGQEELAKAGLKTADILGGGLTGALQLAAAGKMEVADAAEIAAVAMAQFNLEGGKIPHLADLLAAGANKALGSVADLGAALKQSGLVASQFGLSVEQTVGGLAAFAKEGLLGSDAGTSLKTMLLALANPAKESVALMQKLGISAYDTEGNFVGLNGLAGQLQKSLSGLTQAQRDQAMAQIFGSDAVRAANVLYKNGSAGIDKWTQDVNESGAAGRVAGVELDNLSGDLEELQGAIETALIQTGSSATGVLRILAQAAGSIVDGFVNAPGILQATAGGIGLVGGAALTTAAAYGILAPRIREASVALIGLGVAGARANAALLATAKYGGIAIGVIVGLAVVGAIADQFASAAPNVDRLAKSLENFAKTGKATGEMSRVFEGDMKRFEDSLGFLRNLGGMRGAMDAAGWEKLLIVPAKQSWSVTKHIEELNALDKALAGMVASGHAREAAAAVKKLGVAGKEVADFLPAYTGAIEKAKEETAKAANSIGTAAGQSRVLAGGLAEAVKEAGSLTDALKGLNDVNMAGFESQNKYQLGLNGLTSALRENRGAFQGASTAAVENRQAIGDQIQLAQNYLGSQYEVIKTKQGEAAANKWASATYGTLRAQIINAAVAAGISKTAVTALVDALFRLPRDTPAGVRTPGAVPARAQVEKLNEELKRVKDKLAKVNIIGPVAATSEVAKLREELDRLKNKLITVRTRMVTHHTITGAPRQGNIPERWGGITTHAAASGSLREAMVAGPGTRYQWAEPETGGEAFVPRIGNSSRSKAILSEAASWYGGTVSFAAGGFGGAMTASASSGTVTNIHLSPTFTGPVGSRMELENWLTRSVDNLRRQGRI